MIEKKPGEKNKFYSSSLMKGFLGWNEKKMTKEKILRWINGPECFNQSQDGSFTCQKNKKKYPK